MDLYANCSSPAKRDSTKPFLVKERAGREAQDKEDRVLVVQEVLDELKEGEEGGKNTRNPFGLENRDGVYTKK